MLQAIFFDAVGTLFRLTKSVGHHYALVAKWHGLLLDASELDRTFAKVWKQMPGRPATGQRREDDDKGWWRELFARVLEHSSANVDPLDRETLFDAVYGHFAEAGVWEPYPEVLAVLETLAPRFQLGVISNFDGRLRMVLEHLTIAKYFRHILISSEVGADKPNPLIFRRALELSGLSPGELLYAGDDPGGDWAGAAALGIPVFRLQRPDNSLNDLVNFVGAT